jgi:hypothetical protein
MQLPTIPWASGGPTPSPTEKCTLNGQYTTVRNYDSGFSYPEIQSLNAYHFEDVDGDGRPDLLTQILADRFHYEPNNDSRLINPVGACVTSGAAIVDGENGGECPQSPLKPQQWCNKYVWRVYKNTGTAFVMASSPQGGDPTELVDSTTRFTLMNPSDRSPTELVNPINTGNGVTLSPVPLELGGDEAAIGHGSGSLWSSLHAVVDIDGDHKGDAI